MKNFSVYILSFLFSIILTKTFGQNYADVQGTWNGTASLVEKFSGQFQSSERHIDLTIKDNKVTGTVKYSGDIKIGTAVGHDECFGAGAGELISVNIRTWDSTYDINIEGPECKLIAGGGNSGDGVTGIGISNQRFQLTGNHLNTTDLSGTETTVRNVENMGTFTRTITWHLVSSLDVELIVTPVGDSNGVQKSYADWLPQPGKDETTKGSLMKIELKLQSKSGKPLKYKAQSFELKLSNTSREPGITINFPVNPAAKQLPDLRFIPLPIAESNDEDQYITVSCKNGTTGEAIVASYDGGGATTLTAEATLSGGLHIKGHLVSGEEEIQIPKRIPGTMIATSWRTTHGNLEESIDNETSPGNSNNGDGLTVYEEYRGVISEGKFKRLDPQQKEVGIDVIKDELPFFAEGIKWFEKATGLTAVIFHEDLDEIGLDRRLNKNALTDHDYDQYALRLYKSIIPGRDKNNKIDLNEIGSAGKAYGGPGIPAKVNAVVINNAALVDALQDWTRFATRVHAPMPFTIEQFVARITAHELGHGVNCWHHGLSKEVPDYTSPVNDPNLVRIYSYDFTPIYDRPYSINGPEKKGNQESGDIFCIMAYYPYCKWAYSENNDNKDYYMVPIIPISIGKMCNSTGGKGFNKKDAVGNNHYFGDANKGNCLSQIKLR
jgi:hypothetical protein